MMKISTLAKGAIIFGHALVGWMYCGALIGIGRKVMSMQAALIMHAIGAPLGFILISLIYFRRFAFTGPLQTAFLFLGVVIGMDIFVAAMLIEKSFAMFASPLGTWLPLALIFSATYVTGAFCKRGKNFCERKEIMTARKNRVCPVELAGSLDNRIRRWLQDPRKILDPFIKEGMTVLDMGCGPGFFSIEMAHLVGKSGRVIASDLQEGMLLKLRNKIQGTELEERIILHKCEKNKIGLLENVDFVLAFYMLHEIPGQEAFFNEIKSMLKPNGSVFIVEPPFHVSKKAFEGTIRKARDAGLTLIERPKVPFSKTMILRKS